MRSRHLAELACRYIGDSTSKVYEAFLRLLEDRIIRCFDNLEDGNNDDNNDTDHSVTTLEISSVLDPNLDLLSGISVERVETSNHRRLGSEIEDDDEAEVNGESVKDSHVRLYQIEKHLKVLGEDPRKFARRVGSRGFGEWTVDFQPLTEALIQVELENTVRARFGPLATRIVRILHVKGKLDEKRIADFALMKHKDVRSTLTIMQEAGFVDTQEIQKDYSRSSNKTLYFWFFDQSQCRRLILTDTYKAMARLLQRAKVERSKVQAVIDKAERTDVVGSEELYLSAGELTVLRDWKRLEEKLLTQLGRQDNLVALLRDFTMLP